MKRLRWLLIPWLFGMAPPCDAGTYRQENGAAKLEVRYGAEGRKLALSDLITVHLTVEGSADLDVYGAPLELPGSAKWDLVERSKPLRVSIDLKRVRWQLTYRFGPHETGKEILFAFPEVKFRDGDEFTVTWIPIAFAVESQVGVADATKVKGVAGIEALPAIAPPEESGWKWWLLSLLPLLVVVMVGLYRLLPRVRVRTPTELALYEWQRLVGMKLPEKGRSERFVTLLTMLVRRFLERQYALPARRRTTPEFVSFLESCETLTAPEKQFLTSLLQRSEEVKFAHESMSVAECDGWAKATRQFLQARTENYEWFTERARKVMQLANQEAYRFNHEYIGTEHLLLGLVKEGTGVAANVLRNLDIDLHKIRLEVEKIVQMGPDIVTMGELPQTPAVKRVLEYAIEEARTLNHNYVGTEHLLLGLLREHEGVAAQILLNLGLKLETVREAIQELLGYNLPNGSAGASPSRQ